MAKDSFILYDNYKEQFFLLPMEERGQVITAIFCHRNGEELPTMSTGASVLFSVIKGQLERDNIKYQETCEKRAQGGIKGAEFGKLGGRPKKASLESYNDIVNNSNLSAAIEPLVWQYIKMCKDNARAMKNNELNAFIDKVKSVGDERRQGLYISRLLAMQNVSEFLED